MHFGLHTVGSVTRLSGKLTGVRGNLFWIRFYTGAGGVAGLTSTNVCASLLVVCRSVRAQFLGQQCLPCQLPSALEVY